MLRVNDCNGEAAHDGAEERNWRDQQVQGLRNQAISMTGGGFVQVLWSQEFAPERHHRRWGPVFADEPSVEFAVDVIG